MAHVDEIEDSPAWTYGAYAVLAAVAFVGLAVATGIGPFANEVLSLDPPAPVVTPAPSPPAPSRPAAEPAREEDEPKEDPFVGDALPPPSPPQDVPPPVTPSFPPPPPGGFPVIPNGSVGENETEWPGNESGNESNETDEDDPVTENPPTNDSGGSGNGTEPATNVTDPSEPVASSAVEGGAAEPLPA